VSALQVAVRVGVVACVAAACLVGAGRLDDATAVFDFHADANTAATFSERTYPDIEWLVGGATVMEDARLWMPEDATYRVVHGPGTVGERRSDSLRFFLRVLLMPRRQTQLESAPWVFCHDCTPSQLGTGYEVLSDSGQGFLFARRR
jgi:hypothetical protein